MIPHDARLRIGDILCRKKTGFRIRQIPEPFFEIREMCSWLSGSGDNRITVDAFTCHLAKMTTDMATRAI